MTSIGVHHMSALAIDPIEFIALAAEAGSDSISVFTCGRADRFPLVTNINLNDVKSALADSGLTVANIDAFTILPETQITDFIPSLELGAELGAQAVSAQVLDSDPHRLAEKLGQLCELSQQRGFRVGLEFLPFAPICKNLPETVQLIERLGYNNLGISMDILHLIRTGASIEDISALSSDLICFAQVSDSESLAVTADYMAEAVNGRLVPGEGIFPLQAFVDSLPQNVTIDIEIPNASAGDAKDRIRKALAVTRSLVKTKTTV